MVEFRLAAAVGSRLLQAVSAFRLGHRVFGYRVGDLFRYLEFSTALAAYIASDGLMTIANAGHLPPYLDACELNLPGALPLGIDSAATYESTQIHFAPGNRLTFFSDGVVEARNQKGELFGFERGREVSVKPVSVIAHCQEVWTAGRHYGDLDCARRGDRCSVDIGRN